MQRGDSGPSIPRNARLCEAPKYPATSRSLASRAVAAPVFPAPRRQSDRGVCPQGSGILGPKTRTGNRFRLPVSCVPRECRGSVRGALPLPLEGTVVTADALHTQKETARYLVEEKKADYLFIAKDNQPTLRQDIADLHLESIPPSAHHPR